MFSCHFDICQPELQKVDEAAEEAPPCDLEPLADLTQGRHLSSS